MANDPTTLLPRPFLPHGVPTGGKKGLARGPGNKKAAKTSYTAQERREVFKRNITLRNSPEVGRLVAAAKQAGLKTLTPIDAGDRVGAKAGLAEAAQTSDRLKRHQANPYALSTQTLHRVATQLEAGPALPPPAAHVKAMDHKMAKALLQKINLSRPSTTSEQRAAQALTAQDLQNAPQVEPTVQGLLTLVSREQIDELQKRLQVTVRESFARPQAELAQMDAQQQAAIDKRFEPLVVALYANRKEIFQRPDDDNDAPQGPLTRAESAGNDTATESSSGFQDVSKTSQQLNKVRKPAARMVQRTAFTLATPTAAATTVGQAQILPVATPALLATQPPPSSGADAVPPAPPVKPSDDQTRSTLAAQAGAGTKKYSDNSVLNDIFNDPVNSMTLDDFRKQASQYVGWTAFAQITMSKLMRQMQEWLLAQQIVQNFSGQASVWALLSAVYLEKNKVAIEQITQVATFNRAMLMLMNAATTGPLKDLTNQSPLSTALQNDIQTGFGTDSAKAPLQDRHRADFIANLNAKSRLSSKQQAANPYIKTTGASSTPNEEDLSKLSADERARHEEQQSAVTNQAFKLTANNEVQRITIERTLLTKSELSKLSEEDKKTYNQEVFHQLRRVRWTDYGGLLNVHQSEIQRLKSAQASTLEAISRLKQLSGPSSSKQKQFDDEPTIEAATQRVHDLGKRIDELQNDEEMWRKSVEQRANIVFPDENRQGDVLRNMREWARSRPHIAKAIDGIRQEKSSLAEKIKTAQGSEKNELEEKLRMAVLKEQDHIRQKIDSDKRLITLSVEMGRHVNEVTDPRGGRFHSGDQDFFARFNDAKDNQPSNKQLDLIIAFGKENGLSSRTKLKDLTEKNDETLGFSQRHVLAEESLRLMVEKLAPPDCIRANLAYRQAILEAENRRTGNTSTDYLDHDPSAEEALRACSPARLMQHLLDREKHYKQLGITTPTSATQTELNSFFEAHKELFGPDVPGSKILRLEFAHMAEVHERIKKGYIPSNIPANSWRLKAPLRKTNRADLEPIAARRGGTAADRIGSAAPAGVPYDDKQRVLPLDHNNINQTQEYHSNLADASQILTSEPFYRNATFESANKLADGLAQLNFMQMMREQAQSAESTASDLANDNAEALAEAYAQVAQDRQMIQSMTDTLQQLLQLKNI